MQVKVASAVGSAASLLAGIAVPIAFPHIDPWIGKGLLVLAATLAALAIGLFWPYRKNSSHGGVAQSTHGAHSPNLSGTFHGDVNIHPVRADYQPRKSPYGTGRFRNFDDDDISQLLRRPSIGEQVLRQMRRGADRCPEMPIWRAIEHVRAVIADDDSNASFPRARREIRQAALEGRLSIWGRREIPPSHMQDEQKASGVWSKISSDYWHEHELNQTSTVDRFDDRDHTWNEAFKAKIGQRYWSLRVSENAVKRLWKVLPKADKS